MKTHWLKCKKCGWFFFQNLVKGGPRKCSNCGTMITKKKKK